MIEMSIYQCFHTVLQLSFVDNQLLDYGLWSGFQGCFKPALLTTTPILEEEILLGSLAKPDRERKMHLAFNLEKHLT